MAAAKVKEVLLENQVNPEFAIHLPPSFLEYHPVLSSFLSQAFPVIRWEEAKFLNDMPKVVVGSSDHLVMLHLMNGDNWTRSLVDLFLAGHFKQDGIGGQNVEKLGLLEIFYDQRMDRRGLKYFFIDKIMKSFAVKGQGSLTKLIAKLMKHVTEVDYRVKIDGHSALDSFQSEKEGTDVINLTVAFEMLDKLIEEGSINDDDLDSVIAGIDLGNLPLAKAICERYGWDLAVMDKKHVPAADELSHIVISKLIYGNVRGKRVILVDDMISSGSTLVEAVREVIEHGAAEVIICAAHPVLVGDYYKHLEDLLDNEKVKIVMTTNFIPQQRPYVEGRPVKKSRPYVIKDGVSKEVRTFDANEFVGMVVQVLMNTGGNVEKIRRELATHVIEPADKFELFEELTKEVYPNDKEVDGIYLEGARVVYFDKDG